MKSYFFKLIWIFLSFHLIGQQGDGGIPTTFSKFYNSQIEIPEYTFLQPDIQQLKIEDKANDSLKTGPWRFGYNYITDLNLENSGTWITKENGDQIWMLQVSCEQAKTINLTFSNTEIPSGNELFVYNPSKSFVLGKFTQKHIYKGELGTELVPGERLIVEYYVPKRNLAEIGSIQITKVTYGYRTASEFQEKAFGQSGDCNMNVNCPDGLPYTDSRNSTLMLVSGSNGFCTGALINNTEMDGKPYVLTANHCYSNNVASWIFRFNWQADNCDNPITSPSFESVSGAVLRARRSPSDVCLLEITGGLSNGTVPENCNPYFSGWNNGDQAPSSAYSIHHPRGDIKKISFGDAPPTPVQAMNSPEANSSWKVIWDRNTVTEGGSSGAPLFNNIGQIIGQLWGGSSGCGNAGTSGAYDYYGRLHNSWNPEGSNFSSQLAHWLDPLQTGSTSIPGYNPYQELLEYNASLYTILGTKNQECADFFYPSIEIFNKGSVNLTSLNIRYIYNGTLQNLDWTGNLSSYESEVVELPLFIINEGVNTIEIELINPNNQTDEDLSDNYVSTTFQANPNGTEVDFKFYTSCWPEENSWLLKDLSGNILYYGVDYPTGSNSNFLISEQFCLPDGCYQLVLKDVYGDGVKGSIYGSCDYDGSMVLTQVETNEILASLSEEDADFGYQVTFDFCINKDIGIKDHVMNEEINIYPNPSDGSFYITSTSTEDKTIKIIDVTGKIVAQDYISGQSPYLFTTDLRPGIYWIVADTKNNQAITKIIIR